MGRWDITIEYRWADGDIVRLPELAADLVRQNVDLIVAPNTAAAVAAKNATSNIPVVMVFPSEPVELKLVSTGRAGTSLARLSRRDPDSTASCSRR